MNVLTWIFVSIPLIVIPALVCVSVYFAAGYCKSKLEERQYRRISWRGSALHVEMDGWELRDVRWRRVADRIEVEYTVENHYIGVAVYRNVFVDVFQRGVSLDEIGESERVRLLRGAQVRLGQAFRARDASTPVIRLDEDETSGI